MKKIFYSRHKSNIRASQIQLAGDESIDSFVIEIHVLAKSCNLGKLEDGLIWDRIVVGCRDEKLWKNLQMISDFTLKGVVNRTRQNEAIKFQQKYLRLAEYNRAEQLTEKDNVVHSVERK